VSAGPTSAVSPLGVLLERYVRAERVVEQTAELVAQRRRALADAERVLIFARRELAHFRGELRAAGYVVDDAGELQDGAELRRRTDRPTSSSS
jgi:hypothetical protein